MANEINIRLQGHEKFALREGWLTKGIRGVSNPEYDNVFLEKDAAEIFGIGNNMVKSLRYWMRVLGLTNEIGTELSRFGELVNEYDKYIEDMFTLWIMHSYITKDIHNATTWYMYFNRCDADDVEKNQIHRIIYREIVKYTEGQKMPAEKSLDSDIDVLLSMYSKRREKDDPEDKSVSPFCQLELVKNSLGRYSKIHPSVRDFSEYVVLYEIACSLCSNEGLSIETLINGDNGLSKTYNLSSVVSNELLDKLDAAGYVRVDRTAGLDMIYPLKKLESFEIIREYYENR